MDDSMVLRSMMGVLLDLDIVKRWDDDIYYIWEDAWVICYSYYGER